MGHSLPQRLTAEFVGTFALVFIGAGAVASQGVVGGQPLLGVAIAHGFAIATMVSAVGHVSGAHFNPAVTAGAWVAQKIQAADALAYVIAQILGATVGALLLKFSLPDVVWDQSGAVPALGGGIQTGQAILIEAVLTFFLVWVVFATAIDPDGSFGKIAGLAIGFVIVMDILAGGAFTGAAMNPARWLGPALAMGNFDNALVWIIGPIAGGIIAASLYDLIILRPRGAGGPAEPGEAPHGWGAHGEDADSTRGADEGAFGGHGAETP